MIEIHGKLRFSRNAEEVFEFVSDFCNLTEWDPGIAEVYSIALGPQLGSRYEVVAAFAGRRIPMTYEVTKWEPERNVAVITGSASGLVAIDRIEVSAVGDGCELLWTATFEFSGAKRFMLPFMRPLLARMGRKAMNGLAERLGGRVI